MDEKASASPKYVRSPLRGALIAAVQLQLPKSAEHQPRPKA